MRRAHHAVFSRQMFSTEREEAIVLGLSAVRMAHGCTCSPGQGTQMQSSVLLGFAFSGREAKRMLIFCDH